MTDKEQIINLKNTGGKMLTFNLKKEWFEKIKSGEKTHEYRQRTNYWYRRLFYYWYKTKNKESFDDKETICFACGYPAKDDFSRRLEAKIKNISIRNGLDTDLKVDTDVFDIEFELIKG